MNAATKAAGTSSFKKVSVALLVAAALTGGLMSWFASTHPDGLEWSISQSTGKEELEPPKSRLYFWLATLQQRTAFLPDYGFKTSKKEETGDAWPAADPGSSLSGVLGGSLTLMALVLTGLVLKRKRKHDVPH